MAATSVTPEKLEFWIENNFNVLFVGKHGVGKTAMVTEAFEKMNLKWKYFSASTMDPWVDFIGVPREQKDDNGAYLELVRPKDFQDDTVEALFFDEYNRSHKKVRNAVMELIQFKSINGRPFKNLRIVWAAINPSDEEGEYDVEKLDPAQEDRFHIRVDVPFTLNKEYLVKTYGSELTQAVMSWWNELPDDIRGKISPRRVDYAMRVYSAQGDLRDVLPENCNISKLTTVIATGPTKQKLRDLMSKGDKVETKSLLAQENFYASAIPYILKTKNWIEYFIPLLPSEKIASLLPTDSKVLTFVLSQDGADPVCTGVLDSIVSAKQNSNISKQILAHRALQHRNLADSRKAEGLPPYFYSTEPPATYSSWIQNHQFDLSQTYQKIQTFRQLSGKVPNALRRDDAVKTFEVLSQVLIHSSTTLKVMPNMLGIMNHCISVLAYEDNLDWAGVSRVLGSSVTNLVPKLQKLGIDWQLYQPSGKRSPDYTIGRTAKETIISFGNHSELILPRGDFQVPQVAAEKFLASLKAAK